MSLQDTLNNIKLDKDTNLLPEHLKAGVTCLGVEGNLREGGADIPVKLFEMVEEMQADTNAKEGDLAVVYRSEVQNATADSQFQTATFPDTVVLDTALTDYVEVRYRAVDGSMFDCWGQLNKTRFDMSCYSESGEIRIRYTSSDGITYTRTDGGEATVDFGTEIYYEMTEMWNDAIGKFIQIGGSTFEGLFKYEENNVDKNGIKFIPLTELNPAIDLDNNMIINTSIGNERTDSYNPNTIMEILSNYSELDGMLSNNNCYIYLDKNNNLSTCQIKIKNTSGNISAYGSTSKIFVNSSDVTQFLGIGIYWGGVSDANRYELEKYIINLTDKTITLDTSVTPITKYLNPNGSSTPTDLCIFIDDSITVPVHITDATIDTGCINSVTDTNEKTYYQDSNNNQNDTKYPSCYVLYDAYLQAPTQLSATSDYVYEKEFYGVNGVETGKLATSASTTWTDTTAKLYKDIELMYENMDTIKITGTSELNSNMYIIPRKLDGTPLLDTSELTSAGRLFSGYDNLIYIPLLEFSNVTTMQEMCMGSSNLKGIAKLNTSKVTTMLSAFDGCTNLADVPEFNTSSCTTLQAAFASCPNLSDESLNNILAMCANSAVTDAKYKYLAHDAFENICGLGLSSSQATRCKALSNYSAFTAAGWTTGY